MTVCYVVYEKDIIKSVYLGSDFLNFVPFTVHIPNFQSRIDRLVHTTSRFEGRGVRSKERVVRSKGRGVM